MARRVNIIVNSRNAYGLQQDSILLHGSINAFFKDVEVQVLHHTMSRPEPADINFFLEVLNPMHMVYAKTNVFIPNQERYCSSWDDVLPKLTVWCKTQEGKRFFDAKGATTHLVGWSSIDCGMAEKRNYSKALFAVGNSPNKAAWLSELLFQYDSSLPELTVICRPAMAVGLPDLPNVKVITNYVKDSEKQELQQECGIHICLSKAEGFGHAQNEARSTGALVVINDIAPCNEPELFSIEYGRAVQGAGDVVAAIKSLQAMTFKEKRAASELSYAAYCANHRAFLQSFQDQFKLLEAQLQTVPDRKKLEQDELPSVSILTPTKNRRNWMRLAQYCYLMQNYPREKLEWVILDDGSEPCKDIIGDLLAKDSNVRYVLMDEDPNRTIGQKRNELVKLAKHDVLVHMDDDDYYPAISVLERVSAMLMNDAQCVYSSVLPMYHPEKFTSAMNVPPLNLPMHERIAEATLCYRRQFWLERNFPEVQIGEGSAFLQGRIDQTIELDPTNVIVTMLHAKNTSSRCLPEGTQEKNGCHFGLTDELFILISQLGHVTQREKELGLDYLPLEWE